MTNYTRKHPAHKAARRLTDKQHQVLAGVSAGIVRCEKAERGRGSGRCFINHYFVGKENVTSVVRSLRYRGLIKGEEKLEVL